jgi:antibiotic biosynthesis monooxygenase (ABM) superfamily enzyme
MKKEPVSVLVERKVLPGKQPEFEILLKGIVQACSRWQGYLGTNVTKPTGQDNTYHVVFRFDSQENLRLWIHSEERNAWVAKIDQLIEEPTKLQCITGLETWFALPGQKSMTPPPRYKMAFVSWLAITPLLICFNFIFGPLLQGLPLIPRFLISTPWIVMIMTYLWMPFMAKLFKRWLYPGA